ncbi:MAG: hypothetical protein Q7S02_01945 [bacterium]|nr:hypothetical protein [bacterium]
MRLTVERLQRIPHAPGVYIFTKRGVPMYVGKAADLRARLAAYTPGKDWKTNMVVEATGLTIERTASELEALLLEANRITVHRPKYNIANRDQKTFLSILVTTDEEFPQVLPTRSHARAGTYFGPFTSAHAVRETLRTLRKIFPFRCNRKPVSPHPPAPPPKGSGENDHFSPSTAVEGEREGVRSVNRHWLRLAPERKNLPERAKRFPHCVRGS